MERHARGAERGAQEGDQLVEHGLRPRRIDTDQRAQIGERVEQHVRFELRLEQLEPCLGRVALGHRDLALAPLSGAAGHEEVRDRAADRHCQHEVARE
jgi:hypothetical protein